MNAWCRLAAVLLVAVASAAEPATWPAPNLDHLAALTDVRGVSEFARGRVPLRERFCLEDTARALVAVLRVHAAGSDPRAADLARGYLRAIAGLRDADGRFRFGFQGWDGPMERVAVGAAQAGDRPEGAAGEVRRALRCPRRQRIRPG